MGGRSGWGRSREEVRFVRLFRAGAVAMRSRRRRPWANSVRTSRDLATAGMMDLHLPPHVSCSESVYSVFLYFDAQESLTDTVLRLEAVRGLSIKGPNGALRAISLFPVYHDPEFRPLRRGHLKGRKRRDGYATHSCMDSPDPPSITYHG